MFYSTLLQYWRFCRNFKEIQDFIIHAHVDIIFLLIFKSVHLKTFPIRWAGQIFQYISSLTPFVLIANLIMPSNYVNFDILLVPCWFPIMPLFYFCETGHQYYTLWWFFKLKKCAPRRNILRCCHEILWNGRIIANKNVMLRCTNSAYRIIGVFKTFISFYTTSL